MKFFNFFYLFIATLWVAPVTAEEPKQVLLQAMERSKATSFTATMKNPYLEAQGDNQRIPYAPQWRFSRLVDSGQVFLRLETYNGKRNIETYIHNSEGTFGRFEDGFAAEVIEVAMLWYPELTYLEIPPAEWAICSFSMSPAQINGKPCYKIVVRTPRTSSAIRQLTGETAEEFKDKQEMYWADRVFTREFYIGIDDGLIFCRRHYNGKNKLIFEVNLGNIELTSKPDISLFDTPSGLKGKFIERSFFARKMTDRMLAREEKGWFDSFSGWISYFWQRIIMGNFDAIAQVSSWIFGCLGIAIFIFIGVVKLHAKRKK